MIVNEDFHQLTQCCDNSPFSYKKDGTQIIKAKDLLEKLFSWQKVPKKLEKVIFSDFTAKKSYWFLHTYPAYFVLM